MSDLTTEEMTRAIQAAFGVMLRRAPGGYLKFSQEELVGSMGVHVRVDEDGNHEFTLAEH